MTRTFGIILLAILLLGLGFDSSAVSCNKKSESDQRKLREIQVRVQAGHIPGKADEDFVACMRTETSQPAPPTHAQPKPPSPVVSPKAGDQTGGGYHPAPKDGYQKGGGGYAPSPPKLSQKGGGGHVTPTAAEKCPAAPLDPFPWPEPPLPSVTADVPRYMVSEAGEAISLWEVGARLEGAIQRARYRQLKFLGAGCKGFVMMLDLEHIEADGKRMRGSEGFAPPNQEEAFNLAQYVRRLFYAPPGHYRQIVFVVSDQPMANATASPTEAQLRAIARGGKSSLPPEFRQVAYTNEHVVRALIYEFEKGQRNGDVKVIPPDGRLGATVHLMKAQLYRSRAATGR